jgi:hypothetical protein
MNRGQNDILQTFFFITQQLKLQLSYAFFKKKITKTYCTFRHLYIYSSIWHFKLTQQFVNKNYGIFLAWCVMDDTELLFKFAFTIDPYDRMSFELEIDW